MLPPPLSMRNYESDCSVSSDDIVEAEVECLEHEAEDKVCYDESGGVSQAEAGRAEGVDNVYTGNCSSLLDQLRRATSASFSLLSDLGNLTESDGDRNSTQKMPSTNSPATSTDNDWNKMMATAVVARRLSDPVLSSQYLLGSDSNGLDGSGTPLDGFRFDNLTGRQSKIDRHLKIHQNELHSQAVKMPRRATVSVASPSKVQASPALVPEGDKLRSKHRSTSVPELIFSPAFFTSNGNDTSASGLSSSLASRWAGGTKQTNQSHTMVRYSVAMLMAMV